MASVGPTQRNAPSVLGRAFAVLDAFGAADGRSLSLSAIARRAGLPKSTAHRIVAQLLDWGALSRDGDLLRLGPRLFELGTLGAQTRDLREAAMPAMQVLYAATRETVHLGAREDTDVLYVEKLHGHRPSGASTRLGGRMPLRSTGLGKAILAFSPVAVVDAALATPVVTPTVHTVTDPVALRAELDEIRRTGVAFDRGETLTQVACAAAPIVAPGGLAVGALSITAPVARFDAHRFATAVRSGAVAVSRAL
ncbi:Pectin degradation repressor protein KdgR [Baekduia alba]|uniref:IclR family transcriptional regulator n=1 Tax=Baekduia alba TaxID=2997333 RepID=UPI002340D654|nr:IclR family transcriptional regulator [Baekduia alba]WCB95261.1 Pectin degradation repressor protein KdgR [Baekduia alba]